MSMSGNPRSFHHLLYIGLRVADTRCVSVVVAVTLSRAISRSTSSMCYDNVSVCRICWKIYRIMRKDYVEYGRKTSCDALFGENFPDIMSFRFIVSLCREFRPACLHSL